MAEVLLSPLAESDLQEIWLSIAAENRTAADRFLRPLTARIASLAEFPGIGSPRPELAPNARILVEGKYLVIYEPVERGVEVVRVLHGARNLPELF